MDARSQAMDARSTDVSLQTESDVLGQPEYDYPTGSRAFGIPDVVDALRRGWRFPILGLIVGLVLGTGLFMVVKTPYKSTARVLIDRSMNRYLQNNKIIDQPTLDDTEMGGQMYLMSSDSVIVPVVKALKLTEDREFAGSAAGDGSVAERVAAENVLKHLTVNREDVANVISVSFESENANKAAEIANAIAESYIDASAQQKQKSTRIVSQWLQERLTELKPKVADAEQALRTYMDANHLSDVWTGSQGTERLAHLKEQLQDARIATAEAKRRYERLRKSPENVTAEMTADELIGKSRNISFSMNNSDLARLRGQYQELKTKAEDVERRVGSKHEAFIRMKRQADSVHEAIRIEEERLVDAYANEYRSAQTREAELTAAVAQLSGDADGQLRELESTAETLRNLQSGYLQKYKEINSAQSDTLPAQTARIITQALPQLHKSVKKSLGLFGGSVAFFAFLGVGAAVGREWVADVLRNAKAVEHVTGMYCVMLPFVESTAGRIEDHILAMPFSRFAESLRKLRATIDAAPNPSGGKIIGVVSAVPKEGKTVVAANLGALTTLSLGARALVVDSDMHLRRLTNTLTPDAREGLLEALEDPSRLSSLVKRQRSGLDILPCVAPHRIPNAAELLGSAEMGRLLDVARQQYDYIIVEIAPIMSAVDIRMVERFIDGFLFVIEWAKTKRTVVVDALSEAQSIRDRVFGVVLNKVDATTMKMIEAHKGVNASDYYQE